MQIAFLTLAPFCLFIDGAVQENMPGVDQLPRHAPPAVDNRTVDDQPPNRDARPTEPQEPVNLNPPRRLEVPDEPVPDPTRTDPPQ